MLISRSLDLQAKVSLVILAVILPTFVVVTVAENAIMRPVLENEMRDLGISTGRTLADEIQDAHWLQAENGSVQIESRMQEILYTYRNISLLRVYRPGEGGGRPRLIASSIEEPGEEEGAAAENFGAAIVPTSIEASVGYSIVQDDDGSRLWRIVVPIFSQKKELAGNVLVLVALRLVDRVQTLLWRGTIVAALVALVALFVGLRFFLRRTLENEKRLFAAESRNEQLTEELQETQRQLLTTEKLAVMGQLTASFAHEIGTPLNAMGGHLQLLGGEIAEPRQKERLGIIRGQVEKIEAIVRRFLQSTALPPSQRQLVDGNALLERTVALVAPRAEALGVFVERRPSRELGHVRFVPVELEQILLNLVNNSLDSLEEKARRLPGSPLRLEVSSRLEKMRAVSAAVFEIRDTGEGVDASELSNVWKPFYTTKQPGKGTGLGLTICRQLANQNGAVIEMESKPGDWTRVILRVPYA